jgi:excisionase family DNA binding protein
MEVELLTGQEAADLLRISKSTLAKLRRDGDISAVAIGRRVFYRRESVLKFIASSESSTTNKE